METFRTPDYHGTDLLGEFRINTHAEDLVQTIAKHAEAVLDQHQGNEDAQVVLHSQTEQLLRGDSHQDGKRYQGITYAVRTCQLQARGFELLSLLSGKESEQDL